MRYHPLRTWFMVLILLMGLFALGQRIGHRDALILAAALSLGVIGLLLFYAEWRWIPSFHVIELDGQDPWGALAEVRKWSANLRVPRPRVFLIPSEAPQALALGRGLRSGQIFLTEGLLEQLTSQELSAVIVYQLVCIRNRAAMSFTIASAIADLVLTFGASIDGSLNWLLGSRRQGVGGRIQFFTWSLAPLAATLVRIGVGRRPYIRADRDTANIMGEGRTLAQVLWKMQSYAQTRPFQATPATSHFFLVNPLTASRWGRYFHAHPEVSERIRNLVGHYPI